MITEASSVVPERILMACLGRPSTAGGVGSHGVRGGGGSGEIEAATWTSDSDSGGSDQGGIMESQPHVRCV